MRLLMAGLSARRIWVVAGAFFVSAVFISTLIFGLAWRWVCGCGGVSGKALPLLWHQALHLARHDLSKINPQTGARSRTRPSLRALKRGDAGAVWHAGCRWHLKVTGQVHGVL
jgi:hypothetical protein